MNRESEWEAREHDTGIPVLSCAFQVDRAETLLRSGRPLADRIGGRFGVAVDLFAAGGLAVCRKVRAIDHRVWETFDRRWEEGRRRAGCWPGRSTRGLRRAVTR